MTRAATPVLGAPEHGTSTGSLDTAGLVLVPRPTARALAFLRQLASFGAVGGLAFVVDLGVYNLLRATVLDDKPIAAKIVSVAVATVVAWLGNRLVTFRSERTTSRRETLREGLLFAAMNIVGLGIAAACLFVSHYVLGFTSTLADNVAGNGIGLVLGTAFRFAAYRAVVFRSGSTRRTKEATAA